MQNESLDALLKRILSAVVSEVAHSVYTGKEKTYIVFNYNTVPFHFSDDEPEFDKYLIQVHLFTPIAGNINSTIKSIKTVLRAAGFTYPESFDLSDDNGKHIVFETENVDMLDEVTDNV